MQYGEELRSGDNRTNFTDREDGVTELSEAEMARLRNNVNTSDETQAYASAGKIDNRWIIPTVVKERKQFINDRFVTKGALNKCSIFQTHPRIGTTLRQAGFKDQ